MLLRACAPRGAGGGAAAAARRASARLRAPSSASSDAVSASLSSPRRGALSRGLSSASSPLLQKAAAGGGKAKGGGAAPAAPVESFDLARQIPVNLLKDGPEPEYGPDSAYPPWLFELLEEPPPVEDLLMRGVEALSVPELKAVARAASKRRIKEANAGSAKGGGED